MSYAARLIHRLQVVRKVATLDEDGQAVLDEYGQPIRSDSSYTTQGLPQPKNVREVLRVSEAGVAIGTWTIFLLPVVISEADSIRHVAADCPVAAGADLPDMRWNVTGARDSAGLGHHLEVDARLVGTDDALEREPAAS